MRNLIYDLRFFLDCFALFRDPNTPRNGAWR